MTEEQQQRIAALREKGWVLIKSPSAGPDHERARLTPAFTFERYWNGNRVHEVGETLASALDHAEWQQRRMESLAEKPVPVITGVQSTKN